MFETNTWREFKWMTFFSDTRNSSKKWAQHTQINWRNSSTHIGNCTHIIWTCPKLRTFWEEAFEALKDVCHQISQ